MARSPRKIETQQPEPEVVEEAAPVVQEEPAPAPGDPVEYVENISRATTIHLGDGRKIGPGETMELSPAEAKALRAGSEYIR